MKPKILYAAVAGTLLMSGAGISSAAQQLICDQQPTSSASASCRFSEMPVAGSSTAPTYYIVEPAPVEQTVVREPIRERVVVRDPAVSTPVDAVVMSYPVDDAFPDPNPRQEAQQRVYIPREPVRVTERGFFGEVTPD